MTPYHHGFTVIWKYRVRPERLSQFQDLYGAAGAWSKLFSRAEAYRGTALLRDRADRQVFVTIDRWESEAAYLAFRDRHAAPYDDLDARCDELTEVEVHVGSFVEVDPVS
jgi:heme-degrading monooxygenase HmoA